MVERKILEMLTCCDSRVLDDSGVIPQAESSTTTLDVGMACTDRSEAQVRMRERISELRCMLRSRDSERGRRMGDSHGPSALYKSGGATKSRAIEMGDNNKGCRVT
jgi:hypothetical protein